MKITLLFVSCFLASTAFNQNLELISSSGAYDEDAGGSVSWSVGEVVIETYEGGSNDVTQGFHQSDIYIVSVENHIEMEISIYPNPTSDYINISATEKLRINIFDASGKLVEIVDMLGNEDQIDISHLSRGAYTFMFQSNGQLVKTVKIIKQ